jgi:hypothetical protein
VDFFLLDKESLLFGLIHAFDKCSFAAGPSGRRNISFDDS